MNAIRIIRTVESETLHLPELKPFIGKTVEIVVLDESPVADRWKPLMDAAGKDLVDPEAYKELRAASVIPLDAFELPEDLPPVPPRRAGSSESS
ncbi:MAG: hypothetical protein ACJ8F7_19230 [Gemmataceae bacterium]